MKLRPTQKPTKDQLLEPNRRVEMVDVSDLKPYDRNARTHSAKQIKQIAASIRTTGFIGSIFVDGNATIISGHGRLEAAISLGMTEVPVTSITHLTAAQVRAYRIADNKLAENAGWSEEALKLEFEELIALDLDFGIEITGFETAEIDLLLDSQPATPADDPADKVPPLEKVAVTQAGDIWLLGKHRLMCGSILDRDAFDQLMAGAKAAMAFTDPPYNVAVSGHVCGLGKIQHREFAMASGEMTGAEFTGFLETSLTTIAVGVSDGGILFVCMDWRHAGELLTASAKASLDPINLCVWNKTNGGMGSLYRSKHELVLVLKKGKAPHVNNVQLGRFGRYRTNVWDYPGVNSFGRGRSDLEDHPTVKPVALVADAIRDVSNRGDLVIDGFMGSGTTLLAAERTGRIAAGMELDPLYVDLAIRRWQQATGAKAIHAATGLTFDEIERDGRAESDEGEAR